MTYSLIDARIALMKLDQVLEQIILAEEDPDALAALTEVLRVRARQAAPALIALYTGDLLDGFGELLERLPDVDLVLGLGNVRGVVGVVVRPTSMVPSLSGTHQSSPCVAGPEVDSPDVPAAIVGGTTDTASPGAGESAGPGVPKTRPALYNDQPSYLAPGATTYQASAPVYRWMVRHENAENGWWIEATEETIDALAVGRWP